ncbi:MAG: glycosyltransferase family 2 protein [Marinosulfonomonas sp.]|nr:glycosyltransferase family 2 protein [Marinosulfonomonas sp.]
MTALTASVVVVSRGRPALLLRCLRSLSQMYYDAFEIVVVADAAGIDAVQGSDLSDRLKLVRFDDANISAARNLGLAQVSGDIVAFIDDDAVSEPTWLSYLMPAFEDPQVDAATGFVRGRNGISFQSRASTIDETMGVAPLELADASMVVFTGGPGRAIKTEGTNCAFRMSVLKQIGGFDPAFEYYLDESDLNIRLAHAGKRTAVVPNAQVHHATATSERRAFSRMPETLFQVGASVAVFLRKHAGSADHKPHVENAVATQRQQLLRHLVAGNCEPRDVARLLGTFVAGIASNYGRRVIDPPAIVSAKSAFKNFKAAPALAVQQTISGRYFQAKRLRAQAKAAAEAGAVISLYLFSRTALRHRVSYHPDGYWEQIGGMYGRSNRNERPPIRTTIAKRVGQEENRIAPFRHPD